MSHAPANILQIKAKQSSTLLFIWKQNRDAVAKYYDENASYVSISWEVLLSVTGSPFEAILTHNLSANGHDIKRMHASKVRHLPQGLAVCLLCQSKHNLHQCSTVEVLRWGGPRQIQVKKQTSNGASQTTGNSRRHRGQSMTGGKLASFAVYYQFLTNIETRGGCDGGGPSLPWTTWSNQGSRGQGEYMQLFPIIQ